MISCFTITKSPLRRCELENTHSLCPQHKVELRHRSVLVGIVDRQDQPSSQTCGEAESHESLIDTPAARINSLRAGPWGNRVSKAANAASSVLVLKPGGAESTATIG